MSTSARRTNGLMGVKTPLHFWMKSSVCEPISGCTDKSKRKHAMWLMRHLFPAYDRHARGWVRTRGPAKSHFASKIRRLRRYATMIHQRHFAKCIGDTVDTDILFAIGTLLILVAYGHTLRGKLSMFVITLAEPDTTQPV